MLRNTIRITDGRGRKIKDFTKPLRSSGGEVTGLCAERMLDDFKRKAVNFIKCEPKNDFEWLFIMRHYGVPTRLLDWSTNALVALYFALNKEIPKDKDFGKNELSGLNPEEEFMKNDEFCEFGAAVYVINPATINQNCCSVCYPIDISKNVNGFKHYLNPMDNDGAFLPICVVSPHIDERIRSQSGVFTLHGANIWPLDYYEKLRGKMHKIFLPYKQFPILKEEMRYLGVTTSFVFPDLMGISREVYEEEKYIFDKKKQQMKI